jgi:hypothetical protein
LSGRREKHFLFPRLEMQQKPEKWWFSVVWYFLNWENTHGYVIQQPLIVLCGLPKHISQSVPRMIFLKDGLSFASLP